MIVIKRMAENRCRYIVNIPKKFAAELNIEPDEMVCVELVKDKIIITKINHNDEKINKLKKRKKDEK